MSNKAIIKARVLHTYTIAPCGTDAAYAASANFCIRSVAYPKLDAEVRLLQSAKGNAGRLLRVRNETGTIEVEAVHTLLIRFDDAGDNLQKILKRIVFTGDFDNDSAKSEGLVVQVIKSKWLDWSEEDTNALLLP